ncbi:hypothetical protein LOZ61_004018 [Ophidiomyces ophidiicola]|uniref:Uncharacterized protein n=1 Tax=Ophidiomyces ophidiicola TaxID=1387563 RepID=A0ACB8UWQ2_9EURO|nr:hypothetical protein LOZ61_004018 [Ophidiomyces ophidiicola]KAI1931282.1 hypothetical protein LOZ60_000311 [Ophidiomyces ophidiicola]KAI1956725.1 hypothetical protein LOZ59_004141 [Ophidiomyces ophidiicola]KAI1966425.1 hypothetical protein LOZ56_005732 [Ophidiomyces ophidiicola]KAI2031093.1 hypothetical protein LOZ48_002913 [Ophidiomyces ophidiicola]
MTAKDNSGNPDGENGSNSRALLLFVDESNPDQTAIKRHVMQNHVRKKRGLAKSQAQKAVRVTKKRPDNRLSRSTSVAPLHKSAKGETRSLVLMERNDDSSSSISSGQIRRTNTTALVNRQKTISTESSRPLNADSSHDIDLELIETIERDSTSLDNYTLLDVVDLASQSNDEKSLSKQGANHSRMTSYPESSDCSYSLSTVFPSSASRSPSPQTLLSAAWKDPFNVLPMKLTDREEELFHFYVTYMPACSYGFNVLPRKAHNWYNEVFVPEAMKGAMAFQNTILVHASSSQAWVCGLDETAESIAHRDKGLKALIKHRSIYPNDFSDALISATLSAAAVEDFDQRNDRKEPSWWHMRGAMEMIARRGGTAAFRQSRRMAMLINWSDYIFSGFSTHPQKSSFYFEPSSEFSGSVSSSSSQASSSQYPSPSPLSDFNPMTEIETQCEAFLEFLRRSERLAFDTASSSSEKTTTPRRNLSFATDTLLYKILSSGPGARFATAGTRKQIISRLASLLMINAALWDYRLLPEKRDRFLKALSMKLVDKEVDLNESVEALLQILLAYDDTFGIRDLEKEEYNENLRNHLVFNHETGESLTVRAIKSGIDPYQRPWLVGRLLKIAKRLCWVSWMSLNEMLFSFLTLHLQWPRMALWEDSLRKEILSAPLTKYVMPIPRS